MLEIKTFPLGVLQTNCYVLHSQQEALVIDPGGDPQQIINYLKENGLVLAMILNTHLHFDHIQGNAGLAESTGAKIFAPEEDRFLLDTEVGGGGFMDFPETPGFEFEDLNEGKRELLGHECSILSTPGHSPGSLSFYFPDLKAVFVGDLLFQRAVGRTDFPGGSMEVLKKSARENIFTLPDDTVIYSGHGPESKVIDEKQNNPFFQNSSFM